MSLCPCSSGKEYAECCEPYVLGRRAAPTAEALMRSRYTAYARHHIGYLEETLHPRSRKGHDPSSTERWSRDSEWLGLEIISTEAGGPEDTQGTVEFIARYKTGGEELEHHEAAEFRKQEGRWYYWDGKMVGAEPIQREAPKIGRNDPCPCGSGKKYKKCCG